VLKNQSEEIIRKKSPGLEKDLVEIEQNIEKYKKIAPKNKRDTPDGNLTSNSKSQKS